MSSFFKKTVNITKIAYKIVQIQYFHKKNPIFGSVDITNSCNLKCRHCYWWLNRKAHRELTPEEWRTTIRQNLVEKGVVSISLTGGEPLLRPDVIEAICEELKWRNVSIVTNGTLPLIHFGVGYFISIDGTEKRHNAIRGTRIYDKVKENVTSHCEEDIAINMTINRLNYDCIEEVVNEWGDLTRAMIFQFHTPFSYDDELWLPYGKLRNTVIDKLQRIKENCPDFIANTSKQLELFRNEKWTSRCPDWFFINLDSEGRPKQSCVISATDQKGIKPICERCGLACNAGAYSGLYRSDFEWFRMFRVARRAAEMKKKMIQNPNYRKTRIPKPKQ